MNRFLSVAAVVLLAAMHAFAWGCKGHQVVALIAYDHLNPRTRAVVEQILAADPVQAASRGCSAAGLPAMAAVASWADAVRFQEPATGPYHYVDIPLGAKRRGFKLAAVCGDQCVTWAIAHYTQQLQDGLSAAAAWGSRGPQAGASKSRRRPEVPGAWLSALGPAPINAEALRFLIHFVGDVHQPLHAEDNADEGGNCVKARFLDGTRDTNLHSVWDTAMINSVSGSLSAREWATRIEQAHSRTRPGSSKPEDWAWESHRDAVRFAYGPLPVRIAADPEPPVKSCADRQSTLPLEALDPAYVAQAAPVVELRLDLAGLRLARLLNQTLGKERTKHIRAILDRP